MNKRIIPIQFTVDQEQPIRILVEPEWERHYKHALAGGYDTDQARTYASIRTRTENALNCS